MSNPQENASVATSENEETAETPEQRFAARVGITHKAIDLNAGTVDTRKITPLPVQKLGTIDRETLWLARCVYSETNRPEEMELVAWTIRNRVETRYRGQSTYRGTVLDPFQFSAFNPGSSKRRHYLNLDPTSSARPCRCPSRAYGQCPSAVQRWSDHPKIRPEDGLSM